MFETCRFCRRNPGRFEVTGDTLRCPLCGKTAEFKRVPLFFLSGASCSGKSTAATVLFERHKEYITMECDILWGPHFDTPDDGYAAFRDIWLRMAGNYAQYGRSTLLCGCITPEQIDKRWRKEYFSSLNYAAIVLSDAEMNARLDKRGAEGEWRRSALDFNRWLRGHGAEAGMHVIDATSLDPVATAEKVHGWIIEHI